MWKIIINFVNSAMKKLLYLRIVYKANDIIIIIYNQSKGGGKGVERSTKGKGGGGG